MALLLKGLIFLAALGVLMSLGLGLVGMLNPKASVKKQNRIMEWRVVLQFLALLLLGVLYLLMRPD
jgi:hypothetical protein